MFLLILQIDITAITLWQELQSLQYLADLLINSFSTRVTIFYTLPARVAYISDTRDERGWLINMP